jgi:hypothetical protein
MVTAVSQNQSMVMLPYLPQTRCHGPEEAHRPLQPALGPALVAPVPTCFSPTIRAQCSMLLWSLPTSPLSAPRPGRTIPAPHGAVTSTRAATSSFARSLAWNLPKVFLFQAVWVTQKVQNASVEGGIHRDTGLVGPVLLEDSSVCKFVWSRSFPSDDSNSAPGRAVVRPLQEASRQSGVGSAVGREGDRILDAPVAGCTAPACLMRGMCWCSV